MDWRLRQHTRWDTFRWLCYREQQSSLARWLFFSANGEEEGEKEAKKMGVTVRKGVCNVGRKDCECHHMYCTCDGVSPLWLARILR